MEPFAPSVALRRCGVHNPRVAIFKSRCQAGPVTCRIPSDIKNARTRTKKKRTTKGGRSKEGGGRNYAALPRMPPRRDGVRRLLFLIRDFFHLPTPNTTTRRQWGLRSTTTFCSIRYAFFIRESRTREEGPRVASPPSRHRRH